MRTIIILLFLSTTLLAQDSLTPNTFPAVIISGDSLVINDGSGRRYFLAGYVDNKDANGMQLSKYSHADMEREFQTIRAMKGTALRWNAFLKGLDFTWGEDSLVTGLKPGCFSAIRDALDLGQEYGVLVQIVLSTAHFGKYGWGGADNEIGGILNKDRVANNMRMINTEAGRTAYITNILDVMIDSIGLHPALFGYVICNEMYGMVDPEDTPNGGWSDEYITLENAQKFVNRVSARIHERQPGALTTVSSIAKLKDWWDDDTLTAVGGYPTGILDHFQYQYYETNHIESYSPFLNTPDDMITLWGGISKPVIAGEFDIDGIDVTSKNSVAFTPRESYQALWDNRYVGGFTWSNNVYFKLTEAEKESVDAATILIDSLIWSDSGNVAIETVKHVHTNSSLSVQNRRISFQYPMQTAGTITLFSLKGQELFSQKISAGIQMVDLHKSLASGAYLLHVSVGSDRSVREISLR